MSLIKTYDNFPVWMVLLSNTHTLLVYGTGFLITLKLGWVLGSLYFIYILFFEYRLLKYHCVNCVYWGKICGFGKGKLSSWFFDKGDISKFCLHKMTWKDLIPDLLVAAIPLIAGIILLIMRFDYTILILMLMLVALVTVGNGFIRGQLACKYCKQRTLGCPADELFNK